MGRSTEDSNPAEPRRIRFVPLYIRFALPRLQLQLCGESSGRFGVSTLSHSHFADLTGTRLSVFAVPGT